MQHLICCIFVTDFLGIAASPTTPAIMMHVVIARDFMIFLLRQVALIQDTALWDWLRNQGP